MVSEILSQIPIYIGHAFFSINVFPIILLFSIGIQKRKHFAWLSDIRMLFCALFSWAFYIHHAVYLVCIQQLFCIRNFLERGFV